MNISSYQMAQGSESEKFICEADLDVPLPPERLAEEFELVQEAFFTDPEDQSAYIYHRWLLNESMSYYKSACGTDKEAEARVVHFVCAFCNACFNVA